MNELRLDLFDIKEFIEINKLQEVTSAVLFQRGDVPHPNGLVSNEIFGITTKSRKETFAYINLYGHFFHPHVMKAIRRLFRNIDKIINGEIYYSIDKNGHLVQDDENGDTGMDFIYDNWEKIKWDKSDVPGMRNERIDLITKTPKNKIFIEYCLVIPAFYRDIKPNQKGGGETEDINQMYAKLIREATLVRDRDMFDFQFHSTNFSIQNTLVDVYNYFKQKIEKKNGLIRKYLMGKNVDYCTRTVITAPTFHANSPDDLLTDLKHCAIPIHQICTLCYPFVMRWLRIFFERQVIDNQTLYGYDAVEGQRTKRIIKLKNPSMVFNDKFYKKMIDTFQKDPESRFNKIELPTESDTVHYLGFVGTNVNSADNSEGTTINRPMTWTDLLFMACSEVVEDKHCLVTRYPLLDEFGIFISKIRVSSTVQTCVMKVRDKIYRWYPVINFDTPKEQIGSCFIDSVRFSNSYLPGLDGDYDGDQTTIKIAYSQEANEEMEKYMNSKAFFINAGGQNIRKIESEAIQTFYTMTKEPLKDAKTLSAADKQFFLGLKPEDFTFENMVNWFGDLANEETDKLKEVKSKYNMTDKIHLTHADYPLVKEPINTTLGRYVYTKIIVEGCGIQDIIGFVNYPLTDDNHSMIEGKLTTAFINDKMSVAQMFKYIDTRDWLGLQLHGVITTSFTMRSMVCPKEVQALKKELLKKYKKEIEAGDPVVSEKIENALIAKTKEVLKDDVGMDLYVSGARGSINNNFKNNNIYRGAVYNNLTGKYDILTSSLMEGLEKKDIAPHANTIVAGAYPKANGTKVSGAMSKTLIAMMQSEVLGDEGSDCGTKGYLTVTIPAKAKLRNKFLYRYIIEGNKLTLLTDENITKYIGKEVKMRSPMYCIGVGRQKCTCNKCAGDFYYKIGKRKIGLLCSRPAETCKRLSMKKFHSNLIKSFHIDVEDMFV